jgi:ElaB/YqjD/DUF883 family membrane-anchored ribosome-binding protein
MTTLNTAFPESPILPARKLPADGPSVTEAGDATAPDMRGRLRNAMDSGKQRLNEWKGGFEEGVRVRPIQSILIAAAVGAAIGLLVGRRSR